VQHARLDAGLRGSREHVEPGAQRARNLYRGGGDDSEAPAVQVEVEGMGAAVQHRDRSVGRPEQPIADPARRADRDHLADAIGTTYASPM
jgi:hypothetical protein